MARAAANVLNKPLGLLALIVACSATTYAGTSAPANPDPAEFAVVNAVVRFCDGVDPRDSRQYRQFAKGLVGNVSDPQADALEATATYKQIYSMISGVLAGAARDGAVKSCSDLISESGGGHSAAGNDDNDKDKDRH